MGEYVNVCSVQKGWVAWDAMISVPSGLSSDELDEFLERYENLTSGVVKSIEGMESIIGTMDLP